MRVLVLDEEAEAGVKKLKEFALSRRLSIHDIIRRGDGTDGAPGDDPNYVVRLKDGWRVVYTVEQHQSGWYHHISVSVDPREKEKQWPHPSGVEMILQLFGLGPIKTHSHLWQEHGPLKAVNLLFPFSES